MTLPPIDHQITFLATTDLKKTGRFYSETLGLREARDQGSCLIFHVAQAAYLGFCQRDEAPAVGDVIILTLVVDDVDAWHAHLRDHGVQIDKPPRRNERYNIYQCFCRDPNGYVIEIQRFLTPEEGQPVTIVEYDDNWPAQFRAETEALLASVGANLTSVEHIGSTAVPGLAAKPLIDIMAGVRRLSDADRCIDAIEGLGYAYMPEFEGSMPERRFFRKTSADGTPMYHLHVVETDGEFWRRHLEFRDYLRAHPAAAREYESTKRDLADRYGTDRYGYTSAKGEFIRRVEREARAWAERTNL